MNVRADLKDITGQRFGLLVALRYEGRKWEVRCDCGNVVWVAACSLHAGHTRSCGCASSRIPMIGRQFGRLRVLDKAGRANDGTAMFLCECACGFVGRYRGQNLRSGNTTSCGCKRTETRREQRAA